MFNTSELECTDKNIRKTLFITSLYQNFEDADEACNKYKLYSMADNFQVYAQVISLGF